MEAEDADGSGNGSRFGWGGRREEQGDTAHCQEPREGGEILTFVLVRLALALARRWGFTASAIDRPCRGAVTVCFSETPALHVTCPVLASGLSHDRMSATPGEEAVTRSLYGPQRRTNHSGTHLHWRTAGPPPSRSPGPTPNPGSTQRTGVLSYVGLGGRPRLTDRPTPSPGSAEWHSVWTPGALAHLSRVGLKKSGKWICQSFFHLQITGSSRLA